MADSIRAIPPGPERALPGRAEPVEVPERHFVTNERIRPPFEGKQLATFGMGCFWGAERLFWQMPGVSATAVGYSAGYTENPTYREVCSGMTGHAEVVRVIFDPARVSYRRLLETFWSGHDPTQGMRQGNDRGTQYRSGLYYHSADQEREARRSLERYQAALTAAGHGAITTELAPAAEFYYAEEYHQQYLAKNPGGYCGIGGLGVRLPDDGG